MRENLLSFINLYCTVSGNFKGNVFPNVFPKLLNNHNHRKKWSFSERLVTLLYWFFVSFFFVLQFEFYHSIQRFWSSSIYCDRHARAGKRASATPRDENHRAPSRFGCTGCHRSLLSLNRERRSGCLEIIFLSEEQNRGS